MSDIEGQAQNYPYPWWVFLIFGESFCEWFNYFGMRTILTIYLTRILLYTQNTATAIFHTVGCLVYLFSILGAIISDSWLGKFKTIVYFSIIYICGSILLPIGSIGPLKLPLKTITIVSLLLISVGSGFIKPVVAAFGADQFKLPEQKRELGKFFLRLYFSINAGGLISMIVTPILRQDVHCFNNEHCFPLAFGIPAIFMVLALIIFLLGRYKYIEKEPERNTFLLVVKAISFSIVSKFKESKINPKEHFLDYAEEKYGKQLVEDIKVLLRVLTLYIPIPIFWALFDQQGSRWTFQALMMNHDFGATEIKPDQMQLLNPLLIVLLIPCFEFIVYPAIAFLGVRRPLQKMTIGGFLAGIAFIISAILEFILVPTYGVLPSEGFSQMRLFNGVSGCDYIINTDIPGAKSIHLKSLGYFEALKVKLTITKSFRYSVKTSSSGCTSLPNGRFDLENKAPISFFISGDPANPKIIRYRETVKKQEQGFALMRVLANLRKQVPMHFKPETNKQVHVKGIDIVKLEEAGYTLKIDKTSIWTHFARPGDIYTIIVVDKATTETPQYAYAVHRLAPENSIHVLWQLPQVIVMTMGEVMLSVTGLEFTYSQAPLSMKAVLQACWFLNVAIGNLIVAIVSTSWIPANMAYEYLLFAGLMFVDMILFMFLALRYKLNDPTKLVDE